MYRYIRRQASGKWSGEAQKFSDAERALMPEDLKGRNRIFTNPFDTPAEAAKAVDRCACHGGDLTPY